MACGVYNQLLVVSYPVSYMHRILLEMIHWNVMQPALHDCTPAQFNYFCANEQNYVCATPKTEVC